MQSSSKSREDPQQYWSWLYPCKYTKDVKLLIITVLIFWASVASTGEQVNTREAINIIIHKLEKGYVNDPNDPGGATKYGISQRSYPNLDIKSLTPEQAYEIYKEDYWDKVKADSFPYPVNVLLADFAINSGPARAVKVLQMVLKVTQDGLVGPKTVAAAQRSGEELLELCANFMTARNFYLLSLDNPRFAKGWSNRLFKLSLLCKM